MVTVIRVTTQAELSDAVIAAQGGDTILLASGTYDLLRLHHSAYTPQRYAQTLTITSEDPANPAKINEMIVRGAENISISNVTLDYDRSKTGSTPFMVERANQISLDNLVIEGDLVSGIGRGTGLRVKDSQNISLTNSTIFDFRDGLNYSNNSDITISGNSIRTVSNDGISLGGTSNLLIEGNEFKDFRSDIPGPNHKDAIQFRAGLTSSGIMEDPAKNVVIRNNTFDISEVVQAIYVGNEQYKDGDNTAFHENILIIGNNIKTAHLHGITVLHGKYVTISDNTLEQNPAGGYTAVVNMPLINVSLLSEEVEIRHNVTASVQAASGPSWFVSDNTLTGARNYLHWSGIYTNQQIDLANSLSVVHEGARETIRVKGDVADSHTLLRFTDLDFQGGDTLTFHGWEENTFLDNYGGNPVDDWGDGRSVRIDSLLDIHELVAFSPNITAWGVQESNALILRIDQSDGDWAMFVINGLGAAYEAGANPLLF